MTGPADVQAFLDRISQMDSESRGTVLDALFEETTRSQDAEAWEMCARILFNAGRERDAIALVEALVNGVQEPSEKDRHRLHLASMHLHIDELELARHRFHELEEFGTTADGRAAGSRGTESVDAKMSARAQDRRLRELRIPALRQRIDRHEGDVGDYVQLARSLIELDFTDTTLGHLAEATPLLERARERFPSAIEVRELLVLCHSRTGDTEALERSLLELERIAPNSPVIAAVKDPGDPGEWQRAMGSRMDALSQQASADDPELATAALLELRRIANAFPLNDHYGVTYAFALLRAGRAEEARAEAERLAGLGGSAHEYHFNVGQLLCALGDRVRATEQLQMALRTAQSDLDRRDAMNALERCTPL